MVYEMMDSKDLIPLDKLITRLRTDLHLSDSYNKECDAMGMPRPNVFTQRKNQRKASLLYYLEELKRIKEQQKV